MSTIKVTTLVKVTSHGSGGRGQILACAAKALVARDQLTSKMFIKPEVGQLMVVRIAFNCETAKRVILTVQPFGGSGVSEFMNDYAATIASEQHEFDNWVAKVGAPALDPKVVEPSIIAPKPESVSPWQDLFYVQDEERNAFAMAKTLSGTIPAKVMIIGASGYGKTSLPKAFASQNKMKYTRFNVALVRDPEEFFGWRTVVDGDVKFLPSEFTKAITEGNAVVVLDELNRA